MRIARSDVPASEIVEDYVKVSEICSKDELDAAIKAGCKIYEIGPDGYELVRELYDGEGWLIEGKLMPEEAPGYEVPEVSYVDQRVEVMQSELEAVVDAVASALPTNAKIKTLQRNIATARVAMAEGSDARMDTIAATLSAGTKPIFTLKEV